MLYRKLWKQPFSQLPLRRLFPFWLAIRLGGGVVLFSFPLGVLLLLLLPLLLSSRRRGFLLSFFRPFRFNWFGE